MLSHNRMHINNLLNTKTLHKTVKSDRFKYTTLQKAKLPKKYYTFHNKQFQQHYTLLYVTFFKKHSVGYKIFDFVSHGFSGVTISFCLFPIFLM